MALQKLAYKRGEDRYKRKFEGEELDTWNLERENKRIMNENGIRRNYLNRSIKEQKIEPGDSLGTKAYKKIINKTVPSQLANYSTVPFQYYSDPENIKAQINIGQVKSFGKAINKDISHFSPLDKRRLHGEVVRHEIDEATTMIPLMKGKSLNDAASVLANHPQVMNSHVDPRVIINESNRMIDAPKKVKNFMMDIRQNGIKGNGDWLSRKMFRSVRPEEKNIREALPTFQYGKTRVNDADAAAIAEVYGKKRSVSVQKVDNFFNSKALGGPSKGILRTALSNAFKRIV